VAVVGGGFTGLWTAHSLLHLDPKLRVAVREIDMAGFGASGRNGGWCVGDDGGPAGAVEKAHGRGAVEAMAREMHRAVDEVGAVVAEAGIDCGFHKGGAIYFATNQGELRRVHAYHAHHEKHGLGDAWRLLDAEQAGAIVHVPASSAPTSPRMRPPCTRLGSPPGTAILAIRALPFTAWSCGAAKAFGIRTVRSRSLARPRRGGRS
jgi:glycine/D-amino acid oxidase-like deaminating enzyme